MSHSRQADLVENDADDSHDEAKEGDGDARHKQQLLTAGVLGKVGLVKIVRQLQSAILSDSVELSLGWASIQATFSNSGIDEETNTTSCDAVSSAVTI